MKLQKITPFLWFDHQAEEAAAFYLSVFPNSRPGPVVRNTGAAPGRAGDVLVVSFELEGMTFTALNGGPQFRFIEAVSFVVHCATQTEVDHFWERLSEGGQPGQCGWLKDRFGLSWQIMPERFVELVNSGDAAVTGRVMDAMMQMKKFDVVALERAAAG